MVDFDFIEWGWIFKIGKFLFIEMFKLFVFDFLLKIIYCNCKINCDNKKCSCWKNGIVCLGGCGECRGINCFNLRNILEFDDDSENEIN